MKRNRFQSIFLILLISCLTTGVGLLGEVFPEKLRIKLDTLASLLGLSFEWFWIILFVLLTSLALAVTFIKEQLDQTGETAQPNSYESQEEKDQRKFLANLAERYEERCAIKLDKRYEISLFVSDDVEGTHSEQSTEEFDADAHMSKATQYVVKRFETRGRLFIVGSPGSGKTVLLLNLAKYLAEKALKDATQPLPVIFNLASWSQNYTNFGDWVTAVLTKGYGLSSDVAQRLQDEQLIDYLLDGLDELASKEEPACAAKVRAECLSALYGFLHDDSINAVICCRHGEFDEMLWQTGTEPPVPVLTVHDLSPLRIDHALIRASHTKRDKFAAPHLQEIISQDRKNIYHKVLDTPFYFITALQVFNSTERPVIDAPNEEILKSNLVAGFIEKKLSSPTAHPYSPIRTLAWLAWLANFLNDTKRVTFELSDLQPSALKGTWKYRFFFSMLLGVCGCLFGGSKITQNVFFGVFFGMMGVFIITHNFGQWMLAPLRRLSIWVIFLLIGLVGMSAGMLFIVLVLLVKIIYGSLQLKAGQTVYQAISEYVIVTILFGLIGLLIVSVIVVFLYLSIRGAVGILGGVAVSNIVTEEFTKWTLVPLRRLGTWRDILLRVVSAAVIGGFIGSVLLGVGLLIGMRTEIVDGKSAATSNIFLDLVAYGIMGVALGGVSGAALGGTIGVFLSIVGACRKVVGFAKIKSPYQRLNAGIVFKMLELAVVGASIMCLLYFRMLIFTNHGITIQRVGALIVVAIIFGLIGMFRAPLFKHAILRICLTFEGAMPLRYAGFLNYATELHFLERDGGQWRFRHQILQDYFAGSS